ncbi:MAG: GTPase Era [Steroidobacteraceae bacterium]
MSDEGVTPEEAAGAAGFRCGFAALVGRPNVGKSTLLNALVGQKLSIVTPRPQTTRHRVLGIVNLPQAQIAFVDTPGLHNNGRRAMNHAMNRAASAAALDADVVVLVVEALKWTREDSLALQRAAAAERPIIAVVNKMDTVKPRERAMGYVQELAQRHAFAHVVPLSALKVDNVDTLLKLITERLPESVALYPPDQLTDRGSAFRIAEVIREKLTLELKEEVPYGIAVEIESMEEEDGQIVVNATIWVDRDGQKPIIIGAKGERLKRVGTLARRELNDALQQRLHLVLFVKVREGWADSAQALRQLGME